MKTSRYFALLVLCVMGLPVLAHGQATAEPDSPAAPTLGPLEGKWEDVDQRFVFLTVDLASTEASISAVNKVLALGGNEQAKEQQRAEGYHNGNVQMDRNGGGPVGWQDFYGQTAQSFYFHTSTTIHGRSRYSSVTVRQTNTPTPISRPPQFDYIYRANADAQAHAEADVAKMGNKLDQLIRRRQELEEEQSALWCKIALRALTTRELGDKPIYRFEASTTEKDDTHQQAVLAVAAGAKFMRTINALVADSQKALDGDQRPVYAKLAETIAHARAELKTVLLAQPMLQTSLADEDSPLGQFAMAAKRLEDSSQNLTDAYGLALEGDKSGDFQRKLNFRGQMQMMTMDFAATVMTANDALSDTADFWKITPDLKKPVASDTVVLIVATTRPAAEGANSKPGIVNLISLIDLKRDSIGGRWHLENGKLSNEPSGGSQFQFPYCPPSEYDYHIIYDRSAPDWGIDLNLYRPEGAVVCGMLDKKDSHGTGHIELRDLIKYPAPAGSDAHCDALFQIRDHRITITINGQTVCDHPISSWELGTPPKWLGTEPRGIGLIDWWGRTTISKAEVTEISGPGKILGHTGTN